MKKCILVLSVVLLFFVLVSCSEDVITMPYDSSEYKNGNWTVEDLVAHFEELGFTNIEIINVMDSFGEPNVAVYNVNIEDTSSDSWFTDYKAFYKGEEFGSWLEIKIETHTVIPTITVNNCAEFADLVQIEALSPQKEKMLNSFMDSHNGEYIEFDGTLIEWMDEWSYIAIDFAVAVENNPAISFSWKDIKISELPLTGDYHYTKYKSGLVSEGMKVHIIAEIVSSGKNWELKIKAMDIY